MSNRYYLDVEKRFGSLRFAAYALYGLAGLVLLYGLYALVDAAPRAAAGKTEMDMAVANIAFQAAKILFYSQLATCVAMVLLAMLIELFLGMEENQREQIALTKIQIEIEDKRDAETSKN